MCAHARVCVCELFIWVFFFFWGFWTFVPQILKVLHIYIKHLAIWSIYVKYFLPLFHLYFGFIFYMLCRMKFQFLCGHV